MHAHAHAPAREGSVKALRLTLVLTATFTVVEVVGGLVAGSLALLADAAHMLSDNASLGIALFAAWLAGRPAGPSRTFGYRRAEILAALFNGVTLVALSIWIFIEAAERLGDPPEVEAGLMLGIAVAASSSTWSRPGSCNATRRRASTSPPRCATSSPTCSARSE